MDIIRHDFVAAPAHTFGVLLPLVDALASYPQFVDLWQANVDSVTRTASGRVSAWTGRRGRVLAQPNETWQPRLVGGQIDFSNGSGAAQGLLSLTASIGTDPSDLTIGMLVNVANLATDNQFIFGDHVAPTLRLRYRTNGGSPVIFLDGTNVIGSAGMRVAADQTRIPIVLRIAGTAATLTGGTAAGSATINVPHVLDVLNIGGGSSNAPTLAGSVSKLAIWRAALTDAQRVKALEWLNAAT
ncbi:MAG: hypothetical protein FJX25_05860 [Alphaproteobacteria bacterium]|nr:hypothetical protein [Alphaproteobacteria bacterium]